MGLVYVDIRLENQARPELRHVEARALVDSGAMTLCIPHDVAQQLGLSVIDRRIVELADGSTQEVDIVAPVGIRVLNRVTSTTAAVIGNEVLLGAIAMQDLDVLIDPKAEKLIVPPTRPNFALVKVK